MIPSSGFIAIFLILTEEDLLEAPKDRMGGRNDSVELTGEGCLCSDWLAGWLGTTGNGLAG